MSKKPMIIVGILFAIVIIAMIVCYVLYLTTDIFKTTGQIFHKYISEDVEKIDRILDFSKEQDYINTLIQSNYKEKTKMNFKYVNSNSTTEEFDIAVQGITNNAEKNSYKIIDINYGENDILNIEYLHNNQTYGLLFKDIVNKFISVDIEKKEDILKYLGIDEQITSNIDIQAIWTIFQEKKQDIENVFLKKISEIDTKGFSKKKSVQISLNNNEEKIADLYSVKLKAEDTKELFLEILKKLDYQEEINRINNNNIEFPEVIIDLYSLNGTTYRITVEIENTQLALDLYNNEINVKLKSLTEDNFNIITVNLKREDQNTIIDFEDSNRNRIKVSYDINKEENNQNGKLEISFNNDYIKGLDLLLEQIIENSSEPIEGISEIFESNSINITRLKEKDRNFAVNELLKKLDILISNKNNQINSEVLNIFIKIDKEFENKFQEIKEKQTQSFNKQFLPYEGRNIEKEVIYNLLELASRNMDKYETIGEDKYRISVAEGKKNEKLADELKEKIEKSDKAFNVGFEYDSEGRINIIKIQGYKIQQ